MLLAPAYWIWNDARVLLVVQALLLAAASLPVCYWGRAKLGLGAGVCVQTAFLAFWGLLAGVIFDFHELALAVPAISFGLWALLERRTRLFVAMLVLGCLAKEDIALTFAAMGLYAGIVQRRFRFGLAVAAATTAWFVIVIGLVIPAISGRRYHYWDYPGLGPTWIAGALTLLQRPYLALTLALDRTAKLVTLAETLGAWLFLPLASPLLLIAVPTLAERFWAGDSALWSARFQYSLPVAPVLAFAAIDGASRLRPVVARPALVAAMGCAVLLSAVVVRPLEGLPELMSAKRAALSDACLDQVPPQAPVAASQRLIPHLSHRRIVRPLGRHDEPFLAIAHDRQPADRRLLAAQGRYRVVCRRGGVTVLETA
jgi:uncharacterized membrane protein